MSLGKIPVGRIIVRVVEAVLAVWIIKDTLGLYIGGKPDAAINNAILAVEPECRDAQDAKRDIPVPKIDSPTRQPIVPRPPCVRAASPHHRKLGAGYAALPQMA